MFRYLAKSSDKRGATMLELIGMLTIMGLGISSMLGVIGSGVDFAKTTEDTIKAINLAREGIEGVTNWRDTNWLRFSSDKTNCWKVQNYDAFCIGGGSPGSDIQSGSYLLYSNNGAWLLSGTTTVLASDWSNWDSYNQVYKTGLDSNGFFTQTGVINTTYCSSVGQTNCRTIFSREIQVIVPASNTGQIEVASIIRWKSKRQHEVRLNTTLTNWKSKF